MSSNHIAPSYAWNGNGAAGQPPMLAASFHHQLNNSLSHPRLQQPHHQPLVIAAAQAAQQSPNFYSGR